MTTRGQAGQVARVGQAGRVRRTAIWTLTVLALVLVAGVTLNAQQPQRLDLKVDGVGSISAPLQVVLVLTLLSFLPAILVTMTCFTRIVIVFHFLRQALGTQEMPSNQILIGLSLFLTMFIMAPTGERHLRAGDRAGPGRAASSSPRR